nr:hypothetical protein CR513_50743 [Ipomoea batatas]
MVSEFETTEQRLESFLASFNHCLAQLETLIFKILRAGEFGDSLGAFRDGVLGKLSREDKSHGGLNLTGSDGRLLVVPSQTRGLLGELLEDVVDEAVHDAHGLAGDTDVRMDLLQHLEDVDLVAAAAPSFGSFLPAFGFFSAGAFSAAAAFSAAGFFSAGFFSALGAIGFWGKERERLRVR